MIDPGSPQLHQDAPGIRSGGRAIGIHHDLTTGPGYTLRHRLLRGELELLRDLITRQYLERIRTLAPDLESRAAALGVAGYHRLRLPVDHSAAWPKCHRVLPPEAVGYLRGMDFFRAIEEEFGPVLISDDELNWRLVRPHQEDDVGPVHADKWFWDIGYGRLPEGCDRFKIWIPIFSEPGANGLCVLPDSHRRDDWKHHDEIRHGLLKPQIDEDVAALDLQLLPLEPGHLVMFHDLLLHGGVVNRGRTCRVSLEFTIFFRKEAVPEILRRERSSLLSECVGAACAGRPEN